MGDAAAWGARDAAVVWHGFTQMACYLDNEPIIVESAEGRELIDVDGRPYLDAISSLWVTTLRHRVPELDRALRDQLDRVAHSTLLGNGNRVVVELAEALARVPVVLGDETAALRAADELLERGLVVPAIRPPTVPPGTSRLRVALSAAHDDAQLDRLSAALRSLATLEPGGDRPA